MSIRENLNKNPKLALGLGAGAVAVAILLIAVQFTGGNDGGRPDEAFYTIDDGQTWFEEDADKLPPFQHDGKEAVRAYVFECGDGKPFVNHLERYTPEGRKAVEAAMEAVRAGGQPGLTGGGSGPGMEVKKPGDKQWVSASNYPKSGPIMAARCPDGQGEAVLVVP